MWRSHLALHTVRRAGVPGVVTPRGSIRRALSCTAMKTNPRAVLCAVVVGLVMTGCATPKPLPADVEQADGGGLFKSIPVGERPAAPDLAGGTVDGRSVRLSDYRGQVVVVNAWASTCGPCRVESPDLERAHRELKGRDVQVLGVSTDASRPNALAFERDLGLSYPSLYDPTGKLLLRFEKGSLNPQLIPSTLVIDREGKLAARTQQALSEEKLRKMLKPILAEKFAGLPAVRCPPCARFGPSTVSPGLSTVR